MKVIRRLGRDWLPPAALIVAALLAWEGYVRLSGTPTWLLPPPSALPGALVAAGPELAGHTLVTLGEVAVGFAVAVALGLAAAIAIAYSPALERALYPLVVASQTVPLPVLAPLLIIWLSYGMAPKIVLVALICFFPIVVNTVDGLRSVDRELLDLLRTFGATKRQIFVKVRWPAALPFVFSGVRVGAAVSVIGAVFGELVGASAGLGYYIRQQTPLFHTAQVYAATAILAVLGVALFLLVRGVEWLVLPWRRGG
ncbi:MAG TPA: ABC transporter permease [Thermomicrobiales bacterium]|nr:ABC transporter permease [Thermomicrobiales bacterium]